MGQESWSDGCSHTDGGPETAAREAHSKNKVCASVCYSSALAFSKVLFYKSHCYFSTQEITQLKKENKKNQKKV